MRLYNIFYKTKNKIISSGFAPMTFREALIIRPKCIRLKNRSVEIRRVH